MSAASWGFTKIPMSNDGQRDRYSIAEGDFRDALQYIGKAREYERDLIAKDAFIAMAILCYAHHFSSNGQKKVKTSSRVHIEDFDIFSPALSEAHKKYRTLRNKAIAHSQSSYHPTKFDEESHYTKISRFTLLFHSVDLDELEDLVKHVQEICRRERVVYNASRSQASE